MAAGTANPESPGTEPIITLSHRVEYIGLRLLVAVLSVLPRNLALCLGAAIGHLVYLLGVYRRIVGRNMAHVGIWTPQESKAITRRLYRNMGRYAVDFLRKPHPLPPNRVTGFEKLAPILGRNKGMIVLVAHFGNWELLAEVFGRKLGVLSVVAKPMRNRLVDRWLAQKRTATAVETIFVRNAFRKIYEALKHNRIVAILIDQHGGTQGTSAPFLGKEANTVRTVAGLTHRTGCGVVPTYALMLDDGSYEISITEAAPPDLSGLTEDQAIAALQEQHNDILSTWIRQHPDHWFGWFHRRFRGAVRYRR